MPLTLKFFVPRVHNDFLVKTELSSNAMHATRENDDSFMKCLSSKHLPQLGPQISGGLASSIG
jgi:hypothetical protein